jgi:TPR repeat protein
MALLLRCPRIMLRLLLSAFVLLAASLANAQTADDGVRALIRGDYDTAVRILRPLADRADPDPMASFFMGIAYHSGLGVPGLPFRSCRYYLNGAAASNPFMTVSARLGQALRLQLGRVGPEVCSSGFPFPDPPANPAAMPRAAVTPATVRAIDAILAGNDVQAYSLLRPVEQEMQPSDHTAEFFLATLYQSGRGVPLDDLHACGLYARAADPRFAHPFQTEARILLGEFFSSHDRDANDQCQWLSDVGFDHGFQPVTFTLAPRHSIALDVRRAVISYEGRDKRVPFGFRQRGMRFLPVRLVEVDSRRPAPEHRQFIEIAYWLPRTPGTWTLTAALYEVVRDDLVSITGRDLVTVQSPSPPISADFDLQRLVSIRVNADGDAEWAVQGDHPQVEPIRSRAERDDAQQQARTRSAADRSVDAGKVPDVGRTPTFSYADAGGCGNSRPFVFAWSADRTETLTISADKAALQLSTRARSFDLARTRADLVVIAHLFERPVRTWPYCTDGGATLNETEWRAVAGTVTVQMSPPGIQARDPQLYQLSITIAGAEFVNGSGARVRQSAPIRLEATAGGGP